MTEVMVCSSVKARWIHDGTARSAGQVVDEVFDTLELWFRWGIDISREKIDSVNEIRAGVLHNM